MLKCVENCSYHDQTSDGDNKAQSDVGHELLYRLEFNANRTNINKVFLHLMLVEFLLLTSHIFNCTTGSPVVMQVCTHRTTYRQIAVSLACGTSLRILSRISPIVTVKCYFNVRISSTL